MKSYKNKYLNLKNIFYQIGGTKITDIKINDIIKIARFGKWDNFKYIGKVDNYVHKKDKFIPSIYTTNILDKTNIIKEDYEYMGNIDYYENINEYSDRPTIYTNNLLLEADIRKDDNSIFEEFYPDIKNIDKLREHGHYKYNHHLYQTAILKQISDIKIGRLYTSLDPLRIESLEKIKYDPNILLEPIKINKNNIIIDGNHRYDISVKLGLNFIPVIVQL